MFVHELDDLISVGLLFSHAKDLEAFGLAHWPATLSSFSGATLDQYASQHVLSFPFRMQLFM